MPQPPPQTDWPGQEPVARLIRDAVDQHLIPGGVVLIGGRDRTLMHAAYGNCSLVPRRTPMSLDAIFDLASVTKPVATATATLLLHDEGRVPDLDCPACELARDSWPPEKAAITLRQLLTHTSGLPPYLNAAELRQRYPGRPGPEQVWAGIRDAPLKAAPGTSVLYSCLNYILVARILQQVLGGPLEPFLRQRVWAPLGMDDTGFFLDPPRLGRCAPTEKIGASCLRGTVHDPLARLIQEAGDTCSGNAGLFSTAADLASFCRVLLGCGAAAVAEREGRAILWPETREFLFRPQTPAGREPVHAVGWVVYPPGHGFGVPRELKHWPARPALGHTGYTGTMIWLEPESGHFLVLLTNRCHPQDKGSVQPLRQAVIRALLDASAP